MVEGLRARKAQSHTAVEYVGDVCSASWKPQTYPCRDLWMFWHFFLKTAKIPALKKKFDGIFKTFVGTSVWIPLKAQILSLKCCRCSGCEQTFSYAQLEGLGFMMLPTGSFSLGLLLAASPGVMALALTESCPSPARITGALPTLLLAQTTEQHGNFLGCFPLIQGKLETHVTM